MTTDSNVHRVEVYRDVTASRWRWRAVARNGEIVSQGEAHTRASDAARAARGVFGKDVEIVRELPTSSAAEPGDDWDGSEDPAPEGTDA